MYSRQLFPEVEYLEPVVNLPYTSAHVVVRVASSIHRSAHDASSCARHVHVLVFRLHARVDECAASTFFFFFFLLLLLLLLLLLFSFCASFVPRCIRTSSTWRW